MWYVWLPVCARGITGHKKRIHEEKKYYCDHCDYTNIYVTLLTEHVERKHSKTQNIKYDKSKYETSVKINLKTHVKYQHDTVEMKCNLCYFSGNRIMLWHHKKNSHGDLRQCTACDYKTRGTANMSNHQRVKHQGLSFDWVWSVIWNSQNELEFWINICKENKDFVMAFT